MIRRPPRSTQSRSSAASDVYKRQALTRRGQRARRAAFDLPADDLEGQVLVALHAEHAHQAPEVVLRVQAVAGLGAARRDQALLLQIPQLADADVCLLYTSP